MVKRKKSDERTAKDIHALVDEFGFQRVALLAGIAVLDHEIKQVYRKCSKEMG